MEPVSNFIWRPWEEPGSEHLRIHRAPSGEMIADSQLVTVIDGAVLRLSYRVELDANWRTLSVRVACEQPNGTAIGLALQSDGAGNWRDGSGLALPELGGCLDIDIQATPFTNTLPIRRLNLAAEESEVIRVVYIPVPTLDVAPMKQQYTGIDDRHVRYESIRSGFTRELEIDRDGFVVQYPGLFRRIWPI
ncbi:MAG TPA: putative glycolipid-binding domain-containing protein [Thermomicrobiales bacterium]|nr:putative glycolipid-binding domain-containing protein [Thermomicrobiales bacterium]